MENEKFTPKLKEMGIPVWCHHHATKMRLVAVGIFNDMLMIQGNAAEVMIMRSGNGWAVTWKVNHGGDSFVSGRTLFSYDNLWKAFFYNPVIADESFLLERFGGTAASQGKFIRWKEWLNIPGPGIGHDGDPNVSIKLDDEMKKAVEQLLFHPV